MGIFRMIFWMPPGLHLEETSKKAVPWRPWILHHVPMRHLPKVSDPKSYRNRIETVSKSYQNRIEIVSKSYRNRIKTVSKSYQNRIKTVSKPRKSTRQRIFLGCFCFLLLKPTFRIKIEKSLSNRIKIVS